MKLLKNSVSVLYKLTSAANFGQDFGLPACDCDQHSTRYPALRMCFSFVPHRASQ